MAAVAERVTESVTKQGFGVLFKTPRVWLLRPSELRLVCGHQTTAQLTRD